MQTRSNKKDKLTQQPQRKPKKRRVPLKWLSTYRAEEKDEIEKRLVQNSDLFERLDEILEKLIDENSRRRRSKKSFEKAGWSEFQADCNAVERTLEEVRKYLKITKEL